MKNLLKIVRAEILRKAFIKGYFSVTAHNKMRNLGWL